MVIICAKLTTFWTPCFGVHDSLTNSDMNHPKWYRFIGGFSANQTLQNGQSPIYRLFLPLKTIFVRDFPFMFDDTVADTADIAMQIRNDPGLVPLKRCRTTPFTTSSCKSSVKFWGDGM